MSALTWFVLSMSIALPVIAAVFRLKRILYNDYPFLLALLLGTVTEVAGYALMVNGQPNNALYNVYVLLECLLVVYQFFLWGLFKRGARYGFLLLLLLTLFWLYTGLLIQPLSYTNSYFRVGYSLIIVMLSVNYINQLIAVETGSIIKQYRFLMCTGFIIFYTFNILVEAFYIYDTGANTDFSNHLFDIKAWCNFFVNLLYLIAVLCIPRKKIFICP